MSKPHRSLEHDELYDVQAKEIADIKRMDDMLRGVHEAIATKAEAFPVVAGTQRLRIAKTRSYTWESDSLPHLVIWFTIEDESRVRLRALDVDRSSIDQAEDFDEEF